MKWKRLTRWCIMTGGWYPNMKRRPSRNVLQCAWKPFSVCHTPLYSEPWSLRKGRRKETLTQRNHWLIWRKSSPSQRTTFKIRKKLRGHQCEGLELSVMELLKCSLILCVLTAHTISLMKNRTISHMPTSIPWFLSTVLMQVCDFLIYSERCRDTQDF